MWRLVLNLFFWLKTFQSTHPMRDVTTSRFDVTLPLTISIHTSHAGCDRQLNRLVQPCPISIHTSHAGCDNYKKNEITTWQNFNPHIPCGMWHFPNRRRPARKPISIHTSHAGCDKGCYGQSRGCEKFQSTHPMRDVTCTPFPFGLASSDFNPHIPCGMWQYTITIKLTADEFQSTHPMRDVTIINLSP